jgi:hypothetical protein
MDAMEHRLFELPYLSVRWDVHTFLGRHAHTAPEASHSSSPHAPSMDARTPLVVNSLHRPPVCK